MQNSIIFLVVDSLILLLPIGSSINVISKALALNIVPSISNEKQDYLQWYEQFYKDESFREDYYNYHKQHPQHHQQQIENEVQQSIGQEQQQQNSRTEPLSQQSKQQKSPSSISQEQMHQQQIIKLKLLLEAIR